MVICILCSFLTLWDLRIHIALDVASGLEYLHDGVKFYLIYASEYGPMCVFVQKHGCMLIMVMFFSYSRL